MKTLEKTIRSRTKLIRGSFKDDFVAIAIEEVERRIGTPEEQIQEFAHTIVNCGCYGGNVNAFILKTDVNNLYCNHIGDLEKDLQKWEIKIPMDNYRASAVVAASFEHFCHLLITE
jgi:chemotaxis signal transduction protein